MKSLWSQQQSAKLLDDPLAMRVYSSRLLGAEPSLVLHGGGNTSVKAQLTNLFGEEEEILWVKGSGWELATIEAAGFAPVRCELLQRMATLETLSDSDMVRYQRAAMVNPAAPNPSVEAILHAIIPFRFVDHTHADAVVTLCHTPNGEQIIEQLYGDQMLIIPYVMPGFDLAKQVYTMSRSCNWSQITGMILLQHGIFTFADEAEESYRLMIDAVTAAEDYLAQHSSPPTITTESSAPDLHALAAMRREVATIRGGGCIAICNSQMQHFSLHDNLAQITSRGPLTPDHIIRTKRTPVVVNEREWQQQIACFTTEYNDYFRRNATADHTMLNPAPRWAVWQGVGTISFGATIEEAMIIDDISQHSVEAIERAEQMGGWHALPESDLFAVEYWELEQAKLAKGGGRPELSGQVALVSGGASGIGRATVHALLAAGAVVAALDIDATALKRLPQTPALLTIPCDMTDQSQIEAAVCSCVRQFGGLDIVVSNAGIFPPSSKIAEMDSEQWSRSLTLNLTSHQWLIKAATPFLKLGINPTIIINGSKNVPAPGPGAAAYSVAKAGATQLARVAALELGEFAIRVNTIHPNAVFDTAIWSDEVLTSRAAHYNLSLDEYKRNNLLKKELTSNDVARLIVTMAGGAFSATTGAQIPIDGGNERVI
ncbi:MAG: bifunctional aldolase/short-chain dehydrogenase [Mariprofundales bacterium]|nr:bifunctional aldolase/short-chain dehydrogenase [Mariprofundales bacterium]